MKVKQQPEDFQVEELTDIAPTETGAFAFYRLTKRGWSTPDALAAVRSRWRIEPRRIASGGLKDRHAVTVQYFTIFHGPRRNLHHQGITVEYLGQLSRPYDSADIRANRFRVVVRGLGAGQIEAALRALDEVRADGVPNYFDDQRFGSVVSPLAPGGRGVGGEGPEFVARLLVLGQFEEALRLALAAPYEHDRASQKKEKALLRAHWGDWAALKEKLPRGHSRDLVDYLSHHPGDFRGAAARLRPELRGLYLSAYQSHLWNRMLARRVEERCRPEQVVAVALKLGALPMGRRLDDEQRRDFEGLTLPLPSARLKIDPADPRAGLVQAVLAEERLELKQMQVKGVRELFFSKGERVALCRPVNLEAARAADELNAGREKLALGFELPRGSYATLVVKRITAGE
jgi:tRNA pseudouridine13 synthase